MVSVHAQHPQRTPDARQGRFRRPPTWTGAGKQQAAPCSARCLQELLQAAPVHTLRPLLAASGPPPGRAAKRAARAPARPGRTRRHLGRQHAGVPVDLARVDEHALRQLGDLLVEAGHQAVHGLRPAQGLARGAGEPGMDTTSACSLPEVARRGAFESQRKRPVWQPLDGRESSAAALRDPQSCSAKPLHIRRSTPCRQSQARNSLLQEIPDRLPSEKPFTPSCPHVNTLAP